MAVKNGASLIVAEDKIDVDVPVWYVENSRVEIAEMACKYYGNPSSKFKLIGIIIYDTCLSGVGYYET